MKRAVGALVVLSGLNAFAAATPGVTETEIKLGTTQPMTGPVAFYGEMTKGSRAYFDKINAEGGVNGRKITLIIEDDAYTPAKTVPAVRKLVEKDGVFALFQPVGFPQHAVADYLKSKKVPSFMISDGAQLWNKHPQTFPGMVPWSADGKFLGELAVKSHSGKSVGFLYEASPLGKEALESAKAAIGDKLKVVGAESYEPGSAGADAQVLNLMKSKPDVVIALSVTNVTVSAVKAASQKGWKPAWLVAYVNCSPEFIWLGGEAMAGVVAGSFMKLPTSTDAAVAENQKLLDKSFPETKTSFMTLYGQQAAEHMVEILKKAGKDLTRQNAVKAAESISDFTCSVCLFPSSFGAKDHWAHEKLRAMEVKGGKWEFVADSTPATH